MKTNWMNPHWMEGVTLKSIAEMQDKDDLLDLIPRLWCERDFIEDHQGATGSYDEGLKDLFDADIEDVRMVAFAAWAAIDPEMKAATEQLMANMIARYLATDDDAIANYAGAEQEAIADMDRSAEKLASS